MIFDSMSIPSQAIIPLGIALFHIALFLYIVFRRKLNDPLDYFFGSYLLLTTLWDVNLLVVISHIKTWLPYEVWVQLIPYGLLILGIVYWAFARTFLQQKWKVVWGWSIGLVGLLLAVSLDTNLLILPPESLAWSNGWLHNSNLGFVVSIGWAGLMMGLAMQAALLQQLRTQSPAHHNRIYYLLIAISLLVSGYGLYLALSNPYWLFGLVLALLGSALTTYIVVVENLPDLGTGFRRTVRAMWVALVTVSIYLAGIYLIQIVVGDLLASTIGTHLVDPTFLIAAITAILLTIIYSPLRQASEKLINRLLFAQHYDYQAVIHSYGQVISNRLDLHELACVAMDKMTQALEFDRGALLLLNGQTNLHWRLRLFPALQATDLPEAVDLSQNTSLTEWLIEKHQPLAQYTIDISTQFKNLPDQDRNILQSLQFEWFIPILKNQELVGIFALGPKRSGRPYTIRDLRLLSTLADQTALAVENAALFDHLQRNLAETTRMKNLMDNVFDSMDNGVITTDIMGKITFLNRAAEAIFGVPSEFCLGILCTETLPMLANTTLPDMIQNVVQYEGHFTDHEIVVELSERGTVSLKFDLVPLKDDQNQIQGVTLVIDDVTETKRLQAVQDMFRRYVSPAVVDRLPPDPADLQLGGHRQIVSILFADIRGFTSFSEKLPPEKVVDALNEYLSMAARSILMYEGTLDKFIGDAVMGIFNAPLEQTDHVLRSVRAAAAMQRAIADYHRNIGQKRALSFGVGLHAGEAVVGNVGMSDRMDYTAIGDTVNLAKRIQEITPGGKVLISQTVYEIVKNEIEAVFYQRIKVKGREQPEAIYELRLDDNR